MAAERNKKTEEVSCKLDFGALRPKNSGSSFENKLTSPDVNAGARLTRHRPTIPPTGWPGLSLTKF